MTHKKPITKIIAGVLSVVMVFGVLMLVSPTEAQAISLNATDTGFYNLAYGANGETTFGADAQIRVINKTRADKGKSKSDAIYGYNGMTWSAVDTNNYIVWDGTGENTFYGVYPYNAEYNSFTIPTDQSGGVLDADWMTANYTAAKDEGNVNLNFHHCLAKVTVNITKWNSEFDGSEKIIEDLKIYSKGTDITVSYDTYEYTSNGSLTPITPSADGHTYTAIVAPAAYATTDKFMTITVDGQEMTVLARPSKLTRGLEAGLHYSFNLTVGKDGVTLSSVTVSDWANGGTIDGGVAKECQHEATVSNGSCATCGAPVYVDLGLSVNWATVNIGATKPEEAGNLFAWGETEPKETFTEGNYTISSKYNATDGMSELDLADDAAVLNWGNGWMMPTQAQLAELLDENNCTWIWTTVNGVNGYQITSKVPGYEGNSIFLPFGDDDASAHGTYWSKSLWDTTTYASVVSFDKYYVDANGLLRYAGALIRPVREK